MTLPVVPGSSLSFSQINTELGLSSTAAISLNDAAVRTLAGVGASPATIAITDLSGKANEFSFTISTNQSNVNLRSAAITAGWPGTTKVIATINSGIYVSSNSTGTPGLTVNGSFPGGVELTNNGFIVGMGGAGGAGSNFEEQGSNGASGGNALTVSVALTLANNGTIGGGGGGAGGGGSISSGERGYTGGGGGGGQTGATNSVGGAAGTGNSGFNSRSPAAGADGTSSGGGVGGQSGAHPNPIYRGGAGGTGGAFGAAGAAGQASSGFPYTAYAAGSGGGAGSAIVGNSNITYTAEGTRLGAIS